MDNNEAKSASTLTKPKLTARKGYIITNEVLNAVVHGIGFFAAIAGTVFLILKGIQNHSSMEITAYSIYGFCMITMFICSTMYHSLKTTRAVKVFHILDHNGIFLLIAGTLTPYCLVSICPSQPGFGWSIFGLEWALAIVGIIGKCTGNKWIQKYSLWIYIIMGWSTIIAIKPIYDAIGLAGTLWLLGGGLIYTVGAVFYQLGKKYDVPFAHLVWHIFVFLGCSAMFVSIYLYV